MMWILIARLCSVTAALVTAAMVCLGFLSALTDQHDNTGPMYYGLWTLPFIILIIGLAATVGLWGLADIGKRLTQLEKKS
jgi:hypothetical protein